MPDNTQEKPVRQHDQSALSTSAPAQPIAVQRRGGFWCRASRKRTTDYADSVAVKCGGYIICPIGISDTEPVTCPDCLFGRKWTDGARGEP